MIYRLRDEKGIYKGAIHPDLMVRFLQCIRGHWRPVRLKNGERTRAFVIEEDLSFSCYPGFKLMLWKGDEVWESEDNWE